MRYRFSGVELDTSRREVRVAGALVALQPQAFALLEYLVLHRERVVGKDELLRELWPGVHVTDASLQRAMSLVRTALGDDGRIIRTHAKRGYRLMSTVSVEAEDARARRQALAGAAGPVQSVAETAQDRGVGAADTPSNAAFVPRFARSGDTFIAYHTLGQGELDLVLVPGWVFPMQAFFELPELRADVEALTRHGRVILFDKRGTGLSDRAIGAPSLEQRADDLTAVLDAAGSRQAILIGLSEGGPLCLLQALAAPERTRGLLLAGSFARWSAAPDHPQGWSAQDIARLRGYIEHAWGRGETLLTALRGHAEEPLLRPWAARAEQLGASPGAALALVSMNAAIDVRPLLSSVGVSTVVLHQENDPVIAFDQARYLAAHIPRARLWPVPGNEHLFVGAAARCLNDAVEWLAAASPPQRERVLTTVLALASSDTPDVADAPAASGPGANEHELANGAFVAATVSRHRGHRVGRACFGFDGPERAIRCGRELVAALGVSAAVQTGQVERADGALVGDCLDVARALARASARGELWVTRLVRDIVAGSTLEFAARPVVTVHRTPPRGTLPGSSSIEAFACVADASD